MSRTAGDVPRACSLSPDDLEERLAQWGHLRSEALSEATDGHVTTTVWARRAGVAERLAAVVEAERECCPFLGFEITESAGRIVLTTTGPEAGPARTGDP